MKKTLIKKKQLLAKVPLSDRHILDLEKKDQFPKRIVLSARCVAWIEEEVDAWIENRRSSSDRPQRPPARHAAAA